jgi:ferredoxin
MTWPPPAVIKQHLIDPEICIRCNTCEATCPVGAITHDSRNYVVDADKCNLCMDCIRRARPAASTTGAPCRACAPTAWRSSSAGTSCRPS